MELTQYQFSTTLNWHPTGENTPSGGGGAGIDPINVSIHLRPLVSCASGWLSSVFQSVFK